MKYQKKKALTRKTNKTGPFISEWPIPNASWTEMKGKLDKNVKAVFVLNQVEIIWSSMEKKRIRIQRGSFPPSLFSKCLDSEYILFR